ncbi:DEAD box helicase-like protein [Fragilaria crotonensis]|nr:DEAD box helicase-like protein [Fragilaria crotonensis]
MFNVGRFDPDAVDRVSPKKRKDTGKTKKKKEAKKVKRKSDHDGDAPSSPSGKGTASMRVIAPEQKSIVPKQTWTDEAMDDFDVDNFLLDAGDSAEPTATEDGVDILPETTAAPSKEVARALHMSSLPIEQAAKAWDLAPFLVENLKQDGYKSFFPIQSLVIPDVISSERHSQVLQCRDVCVAAPTGSGKTLAFCIPVLNALALRVVRCLRALVVLPSRDLAAQVYQVFQRYAQGSDLKIGLAIGQSDFLQEQRTIMLGEQRPMEDVATLRLRHQLDPTNLGLELELHGREQGSILDVNGAIDVLIATPGRLIDHLDKTPGFSLQHLRFLVIDEADRLVSQSYHSFIGRIVESVNATSQKAWSKIESGEELDNRPITWRQPPDSAIATSSVYYRVCQRVQLRKLLFSATMTKDPQKLASLGLINPKFYDAHHLKAGGGTASSQRYTMPVGLSEYTVECTAEQKPLFLLALLLEHKCEGSILVVFTASLDSTHRLARLLQLLWKEGGIGDPSYVAEFSSALNQTQRSSLVKQCNETSDISVIVCSDGLSRGMDIQSVSAVFNYDVPSFAKTYVHRCGRTARAGRSGKAITLLKSGQIPLFRKMRQLIEDPKQVTSLEIKKDLIRESFSHYKTCVAKLRVLIDAEKNGTVNPVGPLPPG